MTFPAGSLVLHFLGTHDPLWQYSIDCLLFSGTKWYAKVSSPVSVGHRNPSPSSKWPRSSLETLNLSVLIYHSIFLVPAWHKFSESRKFDNVAHSFFRDSQFKSSVFLFDLTIFSNNFFNMFFMRLVCCSHWSPQHFFVTKVAFSTPSCLNCHSQCLTLLTSTHLSHTLPVYGDQCEWQDFFFCLQSRTQ